MVQTVKTKMNALVQWQTFLRNALINAQGVKEDIKAKTEPERAQLKHYNEQIKIARWKVLTLTEEMKEVVENNDNEEMSSTITLDDFADRDLDYELTKGEYKQYVKDQKEEKN